MKTIPTTLRVSLYGAADYALKHGVRLSELQTEARRAMVLAALDQCHGNKSAAAIVLGVHRNTLARIISECGIEFGLKVPAEKL